MTAVADVSKGQTDMSHKGELQTLTKLSMGQVTPYKSYLLSTHHTNAGNPLQVLSLYYPPNMQVIPYKYYLLSIHLTNAGNPLQVLSLVYPPNKCR